MEVIKTLGVETPEDKGIEFGMDLLKFVRTMTPAETAGVINQLCAADVKERNRVKLLIEIIYPYLK